MKTPKILTARANVYLGGGEEGSMLKNRWGGEQEKSVLSKSIINRGLASEGLQGKPRLRSLNNNRSSERRERGVPIGDTGLP